MCVCVRACVRVCVCVRVCNRLGRNKPPYNFAVYIYITVLAEMILLTHTNQELVHILTYLVFE